MAIDYYSLVDQTLDFDTNAPAILGSKIKGAKLLAILDAATAKAMGADITSQHIAVYPYLPVGTPDSPLKYKYLKFQLANGTMKYFGIPWIKESTITTVVATNIVATIKGRSHDDVAAVKRALAAQGFDDYVVEVVSN